MNKRDAERAKKRMKLVVQYFQGYVRTYSEQDEYQSYSDKTFLDDMLYGVGTALQIGTATDYSGPGGYERFKEKLRQHLGDHSAPGDRDAP